jgi:hypothetical protein
MRDPRIAPFLFGLVTAHMVVLTALARSATTENSCALPADLSAAVAKTYPESQVLAPANLKDESRKHFQAQEGSRCPGLVSLDFYGDAKETLAMILLSKTKAELVVAHRSGADWELRSLESLDRSSPDEPPDSAIWSVKPGKYHDGYEKKTLRATHPALAFGEYDAWLLVYAWTGKQVEKVTLHD